MAWEDAHRAVSLQVIAESKVLLKRFDGKTPASVKPGQGLTENGGTYVVVAILLRGFRHILIVTLLGRGASGGAT